MTTIHVRARQRRTSPLPALRPLVACLALAFSATAPANGSDRSLYDVLPHQRSRTVHLATPASAVASAHTHFVTTCDDSPVVPICDGQDDGTLRKAFSCALNNDTIDLTQLQCSKITLSAPLVSGPVALALKGPGQDKLTIDAAGTFRALVHKPALYHGGASLSGLYINYLTITNGRYNNPKNSTSDSASGGSARGGCIYSTGSVFMNSSTVSSCNTSSTVRYSAATGGAIYALGTVSLADSTVTGSTAYSGGASRYDGSIDAARAFGGGVAARLVELRQSTVSGNTAASRRVGAGGGIEAVTIYASYSTISGNTATTDGGMYAFSRAYLSNTTVSDNHAVGPNGDNGFLGGVFAGSVAKLFNCTITGNTSGSSDAAGVSAGSVYLRNTIVANNKAGGVEIDVGDGSGVPVTIAGANNLIEAFPNASVPADTISADPTLGPLQDNGGPTRTHALLPGSPAIDKGGSTGLSFDQLGSPRVIGGKADIGAFEFDPNVVFRTGFN